MVRLRVIAPIASFSRARFFERSALVAKSGSVASSGASIDLAEAPIDRLAGGADVHVAVGGLEHAGRNAGRMVVAGLARHLAADRPARRLEVQHGDLRREQVALHPLALAGLLALQQRDQDAHGAEDAGGQVRHRDADAHRPLAGQAGDRHQPAHALRDLVEAGAFAIRPVLAEAGDAGVDQPRIDRPQRRIVDAETELHVGPVVLHQHVGAVAPAASGSPRPRPTSG